MDSAKCNPYQSCSPRSAIMSRSESEASTEEAGIGTRCVVRAGMATLKIFSTFPPRAMVEITSAPRKDEADHSHSATEGRFGHSASLFD